MMCREFCDDTELASILVVYSIYSSILETSVGFDLHVLKGEGSRPRVSALIIQLLWWSPTWSTVGLR